MGKNTANNLNVYLAISLHTSLTFNKKNVENCYKKCFAAYFFWDRKYKGGGLIFHLDENGSIKGGVDPPEV